MERGLIYGLFWLILILDLVAGNAEVDALIALRDSLTDPNQVFLSWDHSLVTPCTWSHVTCLNGDSVTRIDLGNSNLSGQLVTELGELQNSQYLELYSNNITGPIPEELGNLKEVVSLDLYSNNLTGHIPSTVGRLKKLRSLRLNNNTLSGEIPRSLPNVSMLQILDLSNNHLTGDIHVNGSFSSLTPISFANTNLRPPSCISAASDLSYTAVIVFRIYKYWSNFQRGCCNSIFCPGHSIACWRRRKQHDRFFNVPDEEEPEVHLGQLKRFSLRELQVSTDNFSNKSVLGRSSFGKVYKRRLADGSLVTIKRLKEERTQGGELQFQTEVEMISMAVHSVTFVPSDPVNDSLTSQAIVHKPANQVINRNQHLNN